MNLGEIVEHLDVAVEDVADRTKAELLIAQITEILKEREREER